MEFLEVQRQVYDLYGKDRYEDGLEVIATARPEHPDQDGRLTFWQACLLGMCGRPREALEVLDAGLDRGLWWAPGTLADSDLDSLRGLPGWDEIVVRGQRAAAQMASQRPALRIRPAGGQPHGTLVALHGAGNDPLAFAEEWEQAAPDSWTVITPAGNVPIAPGEWAWPFDLSLEPLVEQLADATVEPPLVMAGWSQGGGMAATLAWKGGDVDIQGLLLIGPGLRNQWDPNVHHHVPTYIVIGETDLNLDACRHLRDQMRQNDLPVHLNELPNQGHEKPTDLRETIGVALKWLVENSDRESSSP